MVVGRVERSLGSGRPVVRWQVACAPAAGGRGGAGRACRASQVPDRPPGLLAGEAGTACTASTGCVGGRPLEEGRRLPTAYSPSTTPLRPWQEGAPSVHALSPKWHRHGHWGRTYLGLQFLLLTQTSVRAIIEERLQDMQLVPQKLV